MKLEDNDVLHKLRNHRLIVYNLWYSSHNRGNLKDFRNHNSIFTSLIILKRHLN